MHFRDFELSYAITVYDVLALNHKRVSMTRLVRICDFVYLVYSANRCVVFYILWFFILLEKGLVYSFVQNILYMLCSHGSIFLIYLYLN